MKSARQTQRIALLCVLTLLFCACARGVREVSPAPRAQALRARGQLIVGTALTAPFEYHDPETGALVGYDVEVAQAIADYIGVPIEWREMPFADLLPALEEGNVDMVIAAMYITPERQQRVLMSDGYIATGLAMVIRADSPDITATTGLAGLIVGVKEGATGFRFAQHLQAEDVALTIQAYANTQDSLQDLSEGYVDVVFNDYLNSLQYIKTHPALRVTGDILEPASLGIAVQPGDTGLLEIVNTALATLRADGTLDALYAKWILTP